MWYPMMILCEYLLAPVFPNFAPLLSPFVSFLFFFQSLSSLYGRALGDPVSILSRLGPLASTVPLSCL